MAAVHRRLLAAFHLKKNIVNELLFIEERPQRRIQPDRFVATGLVGRCKKHILILLCQRGRGLRLLLSRASLHTAIVEALKRLGFVINVKVEIKIIGIGIFIGVFFRHQLLYRVIVRIC